MESNKTLDDINDEIAAYKRHTAIRPKIKHIPATLMEAIRDSDKPMGGDDRELMSLDMMQRENKIKGQKIKKVDKSLPDTIPLPNENTIGFIDSRRRFRSVTPKDETMSTPLDGYQLERDYKKDVEEDILCGREAKDRFMISTIVASTFGGLILIALIVFSVLLYLKYTK